MKNHKIALSIWVIANLWSLLVAFVIVMAEAQKLSLFVVCGFIYAYLFSFMWRALRNHISLASDARGLSAPDSVGIVGLADKFTKIMTKFVLICSITIPGFYWLGRICYLVVGWLIKGYWIELTLCDVLPGICSWQFNGLVGLNKIYFWIGQQDVGFAISAVCLFVYFVHKDDDA